MTLLKVWRKSVILYGRYPKGPEFPTGVKGAFVGDPKKRIVPKFGRIRVSGSRDMTVRRWNLGCRCMGLEPKGGEARSCVRRRKCSRRISLSLTKNLVEIGHTVHEIWPSKNDQKMGGHFVWGVPEGGSLAPQGGVMHHRKPTFRGGTSYIRTTLVEPFSSYGLVKKINK
jgi:hypothetical protein